MEFTNIRALKLETNKVLESSKKKGPVVITRNGKPVALLRSIDDKDLELRFSQLWNRIRAAAERAGFSQKDIDRLIREVREG